MVATIGRHPSALLGIPRPAATQALTYRRLPGLHKLTAAPPPHLLGALAGLSQQRLVVLVFSTQSSQLRARSRQLFHGDS